MVFRPRHDDAVDENAGYLHVPRTERAALGDALDLHDHEAAGISRRHGDRQHLQCQRLFLHGDVAVGIGRRSPDDADVDRERAIEEELLALDVHRTNEIFLGAFVDLAAAVARVDEGAEADAREMSGPPGRDVAEEMRDDALREVVGLNLVRDREALQLGHEPPVPPNHTLDQTFVTEVIEATLLSVALTGGIDEREISRLVLGSDVLLVLRQIERL